MTVAEFFSFHFFFLSVTSHENTAEKIFLGLVSCQLSNAEDDIICKRPEKEKITFAQNNKTSANLKEIVSKKFPRDFLDVQIRFLQIAFFYVFLKNCEL